MTKQIICTQWTWITTKFLFESVTSKYKKATNEIVNNINIKAESITSKKNIKGKI